MAGKRKTPKIPIAELSPFKRKPKKPVRKPALTPEQKRILALRDGAYRVVAILEEMMSQGAVRLPYPGLLEAIVGLKAAMKP